MNMPEGFTVNPDKLALHARIVAAMKADPALDYLSAARSMERQAGGSAQPSAGQPAPAAGGLRFSGTAYAGALVRERYLLDVSSATYKARLPLLDQKGETVGVVDEVRTVGDRLHVAGTVFDGTRIAALAKQGAAFELDAVVGEGRGEYVSAGVVVSGQRVNGPAHVLRQAEVRAVIVRTLGTDSRTGFTVA